MSMPESSGRCNTGVAKVPSATVSVWLACRESAAMAVEIKFDFHQRIVGVPPHQARVGTQREIVDIGHRRRWFSGPTCQKPHR